MQNAKKYLVASINVTCKQTLFSPRVLDPFSGSISHVALWFKKGTSNDALAYSTEPDGEITDGDLVTCRKQPTRHYDLLAA